MAHQYANGNSDEIYMMNSYNSISIVASSTPAFVKIDSSGNWEQKTATTNLFAVDWLENSTSSIVNYGRLQSTACDPSGAVLPGVDTSWKFSGLTMSNNALGGSPSNTEFDGLMFSIFPEYVYIHM